MRSPAPWIVISTVWMMGACGGRPTGVGVSDSGPETGRPDGILKPDGIAWPDAHRDRDFRYLDGNVSRCGAPPSTDPPCGPAKCGNGQLDTCQHCSEGGGGGGGADAGGPWYPDQGPSCTTLAESCDGDHLGGATCQSLGYPGGTLRCGPDCRFDITGCSACATSSRIAKCTHPPLGWPTAFELATSPAGVAVAWISGGGAGSRKYLHLLLLDHQLNPVGQVPCIGDDDPSSVTIASVGKDWMIASGSWKGGTNHTVLTIVDGKSLVPTRVRQVAGAEGPTLIGRPQGGPLLTFYESPGGKLVGTLLDESGGEKWRTQLLDQTYRAGASGIFTGTGFLVADRRSTYYSDQGGVRVVHLDLAGKVDATSSPGSTNTEYPNLSWHAGSARLIWDDFGTKGGLFMAQLDEKGQRLGSAIALPQGGKYSNWVRTLPRGNEVVALFASYTGLVDHGAHLAFSTLGSSGAALTPMTKLTSTPRHVMSHRLAALGAQAVAAWIEDSSPPRLGLALLDP